MGDSWLATNGSLAERIEAMSTRVEQDPLGELPVPTTALYGVQTERARQNFPISGRSEEHTSELQSLAYLVCRLLLEKKKKNPLNRHRYRVSSRDPSPQASRQRSRI